MQRAARLLLVLLAPGLTLWPAPTRAEQGEPPVRVAQSEIAPDEAAAADAEAARGEGEEEELEGAAITPPSDVEIIRIKGRAVTAIETDVPESVTQFDASEIEALGAQSIADLAKVTPNVEIRTAGATAPTFFIRGVGLSDFSSNATGAVAIYQDDVAINAPALQLGTLFDLVNVEVLRGPQAAGSGRNASAGAIKIYSREPTGELAAELRSTLGRYDLREFEGALEAPLVEEMLSTRLAFRFTERGPYVTNDCGGDPGAQQDAGLHMIPLDPGPDGIFGIREGRDRVFFTDDDIGSLDDTGRTDVRPNPDNPGGVSNAEVYHLKTFCGEKDNSLFIRNPFFEEPPRPRPPDWPPRTFFISALSPGLPAKVNDLGHWAARGQLRFQPPGTEMDWLLNLHGSRTDQLSTLGQAMGTAGHRPPGAAAGLGWGLGGKTRLGYTEPDNEERNDQLFEQISLQNPDLAVGEVRELAWSALARELARDLDPQPFRGDFNRVGKTKLDAWGASLRGRGSIGPVNFTTISAYDTYERFRDQDQDFTPDPLFEAITKDEAWQLFQELRLEGELADTPLRWEAGGYYLMEQLHTEIDSFFMGAVPGLPIPQSDTARRVFDQDEWSFAFYAGFGWDFLDGFTLDGGIRYNWDRKDFNFLLTRIGAGNDPLIDRKIWQATTGTLRLLYRFSDDVSAYWKYSRGWKPGTFNSTAQITVQAVPAEPETIDAWEAGLKGSWFDGRLGLGASLFYYKYAQYQVFVLDDASGAPPTLQIINANDAEVYGGEVDIQAEPLDGLVPSFFDGLVLTGRVGWLESQFLDFTTEVVRTLTGGTTLVVTIDYTGNQLINSPRFKASGAAEWTFDLGRWGALIPRYDFSWSDDIFFDPNEGHGSPSIWNQTFLPDYTAGQPAFWVHNARLAYRTPEGNIEIAAWVRNLTNEVYKTYAFDVSTFSDAVISYVGEPRTWGISLTIQW